MRSQASKVPLKDKVWKPLLSLVTTETGRSGNAYEDELRATSDIFLKGLFRGLSGNHVLAEAAAFAADELQYLGVFLEGNAMGLALSDHLTPAKHKRWNTLRSEIEARHPYEIHTALGMALGLFGGKVETTDSVTSLWQWFVVDGLGFQQGLLHPDKFIERRIRTRRSLCVQGSKVFDQGLGRSIWFQAAGDIQRTCEAIEKFEQERQSDLWVGIGVAVSHVGNLPEASITYLRARANKHATNFAVGTVIGAHVRHLNGTGNGVSDAACRIAAGVSAEEASNIVEDAYAAVNGSTTNDIHIRWQETISRKLTAQ